LKFRQENEGEEMNGLKLIRRMEQAGLINWFPEDGAPVVKMENNKLIRVWTQGVIIETEHSIWWLNDPDGSDNCIMGTSKTALNLLTGIMK
jgi:hypothetical protein